MLRFVRQDLEAAHRGRLTLRPWKIQKPSLADVAEQISAPKLLAAIVAIEARPRVDALQYGECGNHQRYLGLGNSASRI